ncbi:MAG: hypothetical protein ACFUZC_07745 [Chthoniobacteraceae bacterium]
MNKLLLSLLLIFAQSGLAQEAALPPSPDQIFAVAKQAIQLPERAAWRVDFQNNTLTESLKITKIESVRTGNLQRDLVFWADGVQTESWYAGVNYVAEMPRVKGFLSEVASWPENEFGLASWISRENLKGVFQISGHAVIVFEANLHRDQDAPGFLIDSGPKIHLIAYISLKDARLVRLKIGEITADITWLPAPTEPLSVPERIAKTFAKRHISFDTATSTPSASPAPAP